MAEPLKVDIWSDIACPWCFIGKREFEAGLAQFTANGGGPVEVTYHSFELAPENPIEIAESTAEYLAKRKGLQPAVVERMLSQVTERAKAAGLDYNFDLVKNTNTRKAHELLHLAKAHGVQAELKEALMSAYFERGIHVGRIDELAQLAASVGIDADVARAALDSGEFADAVASDVAQAAAYGITGVPFFVIDGKYGVSGAQPAEAFTAVLTEASSPAGVAQ